MTSVDVSPVALRGLIARRRPDSELLAAALRGDAVAFSEVYRRFNPAIHGFCLARLRDAEAAADATQEVFLRALRSEAADVENPSAWLFTIARNVVIDAVRAAGRRPLAADFDEGAMTVGGHLPAGAHDRVETDEDVDRVMLALRALAPRYRTAIVMRDIKGLTSAEAAAHLHTTPGALDTLLHRARRALATEHARIDKLPASCRRARAVLYDADQPAISDQLVQALRVHLVGCEQCRTESARVKRRDTLQALLPFLFPVERGTDAISSAALSMAHPVMRVAAVGLAVALTAVPTGLVAVRFRAAATTPPAAARTISVAEPRRDRALADRLTAPVVSAVTARITESCAPASTAGSDHVEAHVPAGDHAGTAMTGAVPSAGTHAARESATSSHSSPSPHPSEPGMGTEPVSGLNLVHH